jgi:hypothetical protein
MTQDIRKYGCSISFSYDGPQHTHCIVIADDGMGSRAYNESFIETGELESLW